MTFTTQSTVSFGDTWSATQHNEGLINNIIHLNTSFYTNLFPTSSGEVPLSGLDGAAYSLSQSTDSGTIKPQFPILSFDASTDEGRIFSGRQARGYGGTLTVSGSFYMASATSGNVVLAAQIAAVGDADAGVTGKAFATVNTATVAVPGAAGTEKVFSITMTNADSIAAADRFMLVFYRDADNGSDTATGDLNLTLLDLFFTLSA
jgi:hypothetical protein